MPVLLPVGLPVFQTPVAQRLVPVLLSVGLPVFQTPVAQGLVSVLMQRLVRLRPPKHPGQHTLAAQLRSACQAHSIPVPAGWLAP